MINQTAINLVDLIGQTVPLRKSGKTYRGRCPFHNGTSATSLNVFDVPDGQAWNCFSCGGGDAIAWVRKRDGLSFPEALGVLGLEGTAPTAQPAERAVRAPEPVTPPSDAWQAAARAFVEDCFARLYGDYDKPLAWLHTRGFTAASISRAVLGYNDADRYAPREQFGLAPECYDDGRPRDVWLPRGIVLPWYVGDVIWKLFIRTTGKDRPKYYQVPGASNALYNADALRPGKPAILVEAALDALAIQQAAGDLITPVASGTTGARHLRWISRLAQARPLLLAFDQDSGGNAPTDYWRGIFPDARIWRPYYDDPAEMLRTGGDDAVRAWIIDGLKHAGPPPDEPPKIITRPVNVNDRLRRERAAIRAAVDADELGLARGDDGSVTCWRVNGTTERLLDYTWASQADLEAWLGVELDVAQPPAPPDLPPGFVWLRDKRGPVWQAAHFAQGLETAEHTTAADAITEAAALLAAKGVRS